MRIISKLKVRVKLDHKSDVLLPFRAKKDEIVKGEEKPTKWEGWLYCENKLGTQGWVPKAFLEIFSEEFNYYKLNRDYNACEIPASEGEFVEIEETESGWALVISETDKIGWIPLEKLELE